MLCLVLDYKNNVCSSVLSSENTEKAKKINREHCHQPILCCYYVSILCALIDFKQVSWIYYCLLSPLMYDEHVLSLLAIFLKHSLGSSCLK